MAELTRSFPKCGLLKVVPDSKSSFLEALSTLHCELLSKSKKVSVSDTSLMHTKLLIMQHVKKHCDPSAQKM